MGEAASQKFGRGPLIPNFERFVGIDWSGARGLGQKGIQVAEFNRGEAGPTLKHPKRGNLWSRPHVLEYLQTLLDRPTLVGFDFAFSVPWPDGNQLFGSGPAISDAQSLWEYVEDICKTDDLHMYAGSIWKSSTSAFDPTLAIMRRGISGNSIGATACGELKLSVPAHLFQSIT